MNRKLQLIALVVSVGLLGAALANPVIPVSPPRHGARGNALRERTLRALAELSQRERSILLLRGTLKIEKEDIADILRITP